MQSSPAKKKSSLKQLKSLLSSRKYFVLDLDGTLYLGNHLFPFTREFLVNLRRSGRKPIFLTNNSSKSRDQYMEKLEKMGLQNSQMPLRTRQGEIYTSGQATIDHLRQKKVERIFLLAPPAVEQEFEEAGFILINNNLPTLRECLLALESACRLNGKTFATKERQHKAISIAVRDLPHAVVLAFDTTFTYQKFCDAYDLITSGVPFYATHPDIHLPREGKLFHPDIGTLISAFHKATRKKPIVIGKPNKTIYQQLQNQLKCRKDEMVVFGDRLTTDIKGARDFGMLNVLVFSGETSPEMLKKSKIKPDFTVKDLSEITPLL